MDRQTRREHLRRICAAGVDAVRPRAVMRRSVCRDGDRLIVGDLVLDLAAFRRVLVIGAGKAVAAMAQALEAILGDRIEEGLVTTQYGHSVPLSRIKVREAGHPLPDQNGVNAVREMVALLHGHMAEDTLVLCLISGGASSLWPMPVKGIRLEELHEAHEGLLRSGAGIAEINAVRKHLSAIKGGWLAAMLAPSRVVTLIVSDVPENAPGVIGSGPTAPDETTFREALAVCERYRLRLPPSVVERLRDGAAGKVPETPKPGDPVFDRVTHLVIADNAVALAASAEAARDLGYGPLVVSRAVQGDTLTFARGIAEAARSLAAGHGPVPTPACLLWGGETSHEVTGRGRGGRCTHLALAVAVELAGATCPAGFLSCATDGADGSADFSGAFADPRTVALGEALGLDARQVLIDCDAATFFERIGDLEASGPTLTNVMDLHALVVGDPPGQAGREGN